MTDWKFSMQEAGMGVKVRYAGSDKLDLIGEYPLGKGKEKKDAL